MIDVKNLSKSFGDHLVLDGITESIQVGEKVVIIGPSGSGKSTFLRCLNLLETPTKGHHYLQRHRDHRSQGEDRPDPPADGDGVPAFQPVPQHDHPKEHHPRPGAASSS